MTLAKRLGVAAGFGLAVLLSGAACFTRNETIVVRPDGSASVTVTMEGAEKDFLTGERLAAPAGWKSEQTRSVDKDGQPQIKAIWRAELPDLNRYPASFSDPADPHAASGLRTSTSLVVERHPDRIVYRFTRRYEGRHAGLYQKLRKDCIPEELESKEESALTAEERDKLLEGAGQYEAMSRLVRARNALGRAAAEGLIEPEAYQRTIEDLMSFLEDRLSLASMQRIFALPDDQQQIEEDRLNQEMRARLEGSVSTAALPRLRALLDREEMDFEVMQDLSDERILLTLDLPGVIVEANTAYVKETQASWEIPSEDIINGDVVLTAVSVSPRDTVSR